MFDDTHGQGGAAVVAALGGYSSLDATPTTTISAHKTVDRLRQRQPRRPPQASKRRLRPTVSTNDNGRMHIVPQMGLASRESSSFQPSAIPMLVHNGTEAYIRAGAAAARLEADTTALLSNTCVASTTTSTNIGPFNGPVRTKRNHHRPIMPPSVINNHQTLEIASSLIKAKTLLMFVFLTIALHLQGAHGSQATARLLSNTADQQQQQLLQPKAEALISNRASSSSNNGKTDGPLQQTSATTNVIVIKYANLTTNKDGQPLASEQGVQEQLNTYNLYEPLTVQVIESKFAHSIQLFDVSQNQLSTLSKDLFCPLSNDVRQLNISLNLLENFDCLGLISQAGQLCLSELRILDMSFNLIKHLPATGVATLHNLEILNLSHNLIESLDELALSSLFKLIKLDLSHNKIQQLPMRVFHKSTSMQVLKLQSNFLQNTVDQMLLSGLISLEELNLSHNNISRVSELAFVDKINLTRVDLRHNQITGLRQDTLRVTSVKQSSGYRQRLHHNGQYAGVAPRQTHSQSVSAEFLLASNPFVCDCHLEWMRTFQPSHAIKRTVLSSSSSLASTGEHRRQTHHSGSAHMTDSMMLADQADLGAQLMQLAADPHHHRHQQTSYQNDQPPVIIAPPSSSDSSNNISEIISPNQPQTPSSNSESATVQPGSRPIATLLASGPNSHQQQHVTHHYARIGDLELIKCSPLFRRDNLARNRHSHHSHHGSHRGGSAGASLVSAQTRALAPPGGAHHGSHHSQRQENMIDLLTADSSNFLCSYKSHCFALCQCCEFDACDCEMICPQNCSCYYDSSWRTNIIDCSASNHTAVPDRIPMDVSGLYLDGNNIDSLRPSNLIARKLLKTLYLNSSNLQYIANRTFNGLIELQTLYLHENQLRTLNGYEFEPLVQLKALYLQSNRLDHISNQTFIYLRSLEILDLSKNRLTSANMDLFWSIGHHNIRLRQLSISQNWWSCQCSAINQFRQILRQKFLLNGSVQIADKSQLRCYYNSTAVGPLILTDGSSHNSMSIGASLSQAFFASFSLSAGGGASGNGGDGGLQQRQQTTQLTEINQCSEIIQDHPVEADVNPPLTHPVTDFPGALNTPSNDFPSSDPISRPEIPSHPSPQNPASEQPMDPPMTPPQDISSNNHGPYNDGGLGQRLDQNRIADGGVGGIPLTSFILLSILLVGVMVVAVCIFAFARQQRRYLQSRHKKSSAASTTSASSSASSTAISSLNGKSARGHHLQHPHGLHHHATLQQHHHLNQQQQQQQQHQHQAHSLHHHLIMSGSGNASAASGNGINHLNQSLSHHHHSASSQSNIYAALVSPTNGNSTTVTTNINSNNNAANNNSANIVGANGIINNHVNLYSNSSTTASQSSHGGGGGVNGAYPQHWQTSVGQQHQVYSHPYSDMNALENPYAIGGAAAASQASYKTGSLYGAPTCGNGAPGNETSLGGNLGNGLAGSASDWIKLPKVKQFMSKLVNKSLAIGGYRSCSRDELSAIASDKIYDAFISYDKRDEAFVLQHLSAELEYGQPQYRIADRYRDLPLPTSAYIAEAITSVIGCSYRTILVLTENYLASEWCRYELKAALREAGIDKSHKIVAVVLDPKCLLDMDAEMRALLTNSGPNVSIYGAHQSPAANHNGLQQQPPQLVQLDNFQAGGGAPPEPANATAASQLVATLTNFGSALEGQQVHSTTAQLATSRITFINYNERKFWPKIKQLMPQPRPTAQALTLTTKS